jgi:surface antigen
VKRAVAVLTAAIVLAACSSDDGGGGGEAASTTSAAPTTTTVPAPTPEELADAVCHAQRVPSRARVTDPELTELSGLVALDSGWWAHNDSGDRARVFRLAEDGTTQAVVSLEGVEATDWEDSSGAGPSAGELFIGDIGDNEGVRPEVLVQHITIPDPPPTGAVTIPAADVQTITLHYPNGARDAETLLVDPVSRDLVVVHKRFGGASELYRAPESDWSDGDAQLVQEGTVEVGDSPLDATTGGDIGFDGQVVALRTYAGILVFARQESQTVTQALAQNPPCDATAPVELQGEAFAFTPEGYVTISEGENPVVNRFRVTPPVPGE